MQLLTPKEASNILAVSRSTVRAMLIEGVIPCITFRRDKRKKILRVSEQALERWLRAREQSGVEAAPDQMNPWEGTIDARMLTPRKHR